MSIKPGQINADFSFSYAPGKIILAGEHAVVYGYEAIAMAIDRGVRVAVSALEEEKQKVGPILRAIGLGLVEEVGLGLEYKGPKVLQGALERLVELCGDRVRKLCFTIDSAIPVGRGLGSSAALSVGIIRGIFRHFGEKITTDKMTFLAFELEKVFHGNPSGIDHTVVGSGGIISFRKSKDEFTVTKLESKRELKFAIGVASSRSSTLNAVRQLSIKKQRNPKIYNHIFLGIEQIVLEMKHALSDGALSRVGELMNINQGYLNSLGLSTPDLESLCCIARERGALGAKLTGAGGGGAVIALVDGDQTPIIEAFLAAGFFAFTASSDS